jgi:16S rRNA processing protein RimM
VAAKPSSLAENIVVMGQIIAPHGIKGWVKLKVFTETPDSLLDYPIWWLNTRAGWLEYEVAEAESRESGLVARIEGFDDRTAAEALKGLQVGIPRAELPKPGRGEHYWTDLIGLEVVNKQDERLGVIEQLIQTAANDVLVVREEDFGGAAAPANVPPKRVERLIPYIESVIVSVDLANRRIVVDWDLDY